MKVKAKPTRIQFGDANTSDERIISMILDKKTILLYNWTDAGNALELAFQPRYGSIVNFQWFKNGYILVAFSLGYVVIISTHANEIGREQFCAKYHRDLLKDISYSPNYSVMSTCGDSNVIKIVDMSTWKDIHSEFVDRDLGSVETISWSPDGVLLAATTKLGILLLYRVKKETVDITDTFARDRDSAIGELTFGCLFLFAFSLFLAVVAETNDISWISLIYYFCEIPQTL